ncbi:MAG: hypothetical protein GY870_12825 [archaeon]|nr:hypothetical protein [archaeon]
MNQTSENVTKSEGIWRSIYDNLYNSTYDMYMSTCGTNGAMINYNMTLVDNSWMLRATLDLFKSTGNITYYNAALAHFNGIESNMYNSTNCSYYSTINIDQEKIESKTIEGYNNLIASLMQFQEIYDWTVLTPLDLSNSLNHMYLINNTFNISINVNISHDFSYDAVNSHWSISAPINNSQIIYTLRYANNDTIIHSQVGITDSNGTDNYEYEYPTSLPIGYYKLSVLANCSNYANPISEMINNIEIFSGIEAISITQVGETIFPGEKTLYNISITSIRSDNLTVNIKNDGDSFDEEILNDINVENDTTTYVLMNVSVKDTVDWVEDQEIIVTIYNNSLEMKSITPSISVSSPLSFIELFFEKEIIFPNPFDITISFQNLRTITPESSIKVEVNGIGIESHSETISESIAAQEIKTFEVSISPETDTLPGLHTFQVNLSKDGISFWLNEYTVEIVPEIEILEINGFSSIIQGQMPYITFKIVNNNESSKPVSITSNGINIAEDYLLNPGENVFTVDIDGVLINPYDITQKNYEIKVYNENGDLIGLKTINIDLLLSPGNLFFFYILPIIVPVGILLYFQHKKIEEEKRSK